jgi:phospholipase C
VQGVRDGQGKIRVPRGFARSDRSVMLAGVERARAKRRLRHRDHAADVDALPDPELAAGTERLPEIRHIVVLMMENHSFDNYFGTLGHGSGFHLGADGKPTDDNPSKEGPVPVHHLGSPVQKHGVPTQSWNASHIQFNGGKNDGFVRSIEETVPGSSAADARVAMGYWSQEDLPFYASLARTYALADHWYSSCLGPTFPNRRFLIAATANGLIDDVVVGMIDYPKTGTIFDLLDRHRISWANYHHTKSGTAILSRVFSGIAARGLRALGLLFSNAFSSLLHTAQGNLQFTADLYPAGILRRLGHLRTIDQFFADAAAGTLPAVSIVDPDFQAGSEENPQDIHIGEGFAAAAIDAVTHGRGWEHTLLIWCYDEHGGYYDHVAPPPAVEPDDQPPRSLLDAGAPVRWLLHAFGKDDDLENIDSGGGRYDNYGFRVPAVVVSPYAKTGHVSSTHYDHTSVLRLIEEKWNLPPLTARDAHAVAPLDMVDLTAPPRLTPPALAPPAVRWPPATPKYSRRVRVAQALGFVGRRLPEVSASTTDPKEDQ